MDCVVHGVAKSWKTTEQLLLSYICGLPPTPILPLEVTAEHRALPLAAPTSYLTHGRERTHVSATVCLSPRLLPPLLQVSSLRLRLFLPCK